MSQFMKRPTKAPHRCLAGAGGGRSQSEAVFKTEPERRLALPLWGRARGLLAVMTTCGEAGVPLLTKAPPRLKVY